MSDISREVVHGWLERFQRVLQRRAHAEGRRVRDFACTIAAAVIADDCGIFVQVGDGAIVISPPDEPSEYCWVFWPERGEYENTTSFLSDPAAVDQFAFECREQCYDEIALFTDGLQRIALNVRDQTAHSPFFRPMFEPLRSARAADNDRLNDDLLRFLGAPRVNDLIDDDRTLILATRRSSLGMRS